LRQLNRELISRRPDVLWRDSKSMTFPPQWHRSFEISAGIVRLRVTGELVNQSLDDAQHQDQLFIPHLTLLPCRRLAKLLILIFLALSPVGYAQFKTPPDLSNASIEDLMGLEVTSASKREQKVSQVAAAIFVITQEDIRRSGATNIPDLLRMVPGLDVAQITASTWAITARGFNGQFADKLLVMVDGRTVYDPSNSGVYWDAQDLVLEDIDRIEVIRGPGATLWGTNAVNGVINIITKSSKDTQGGMLSGGGNAEDAFGTVRYGGKLGEHATYRVFGKYLNYGALEDLSGENAADGWQMRHGGFRTDWDASKRDLLTVQGDIFGIISGDPFPVGPSLQPPYYSPPFTSIMDFSGGNVLSRWTRNIHPGSEIQVQAYFDRITRVDSTDPELRSTFDIDFQHHLTLGDRHDVVWGFGYRDNVDHEGQGFRVSFNPSAYANSIENIFGQDEITLLPYKLWLTVGTKLEWNRYTGHEVEPSASLLWAPSQRQTLWLSYSHANRIPSGKDNYLDVDLASSQLPSGTIALVSIFGNTNILDESLDAYEVGYRLQASKRLSLDLTPFVNHYRGLETIESGSPYFDALPAPPHLVIPLTFGNGMYGNTYGAEASARWKATGFWTLQGGYTWFVPSLKHDPTSTDTEAFSEAMGGAPRNQVQIESGLNLPHRFEFDSGIFHVSHLALGNVSDYTRADSRLGWQVTETLELSLVGQNLLTARHPEYNGFTQEFRTTQAKRSVFGAFTFRF
jgi:iron complex outermembrane recepter protein